MARAGRPDPDALLAHVAAEEPRRARGRLKIFLGANAGVGKTYAMLEEARARRRDGADVAVGVVETHGRRDTEALLAGLEVLPRRPVDHRGVTLRELDLDGALARRPQLALVDELAHTNAPGSRHAKRWQDVEELLAAGIDVFTTVNVQHLESLVDVVARITHVTVRETVPDAVLERADEVELIDVAPEELLQRLRDGKVYLPAQAGRAAEHFFKPGNLIALRQLALQRTAQRVDQQMRVYRRAHGVAETWPVAERVLVGVGPAPSSARLVRAAKRLADRLGASWAAVFVETPAAASWPEADRARVYEALRLAESLGAETATVPGGAASEEILAWARAHNATKIVVGKPTHARWRDLLRGSTVDRISRDSGDIDLYVIAGADEAEPRGRDGTRRAAVGRSVRRAAGERGGYLVAALVVALTTALCIPLRPVFAIANLAMLYLLGVVVVAVLRGRRAAVAASVLSVASFDWFCVPPYLTFAVSDTEYVVTFAVMLVVALVVSTLTTRLRTQAVAARAREQRVAALYDMSRELVSTAAAEDVVRAGLVHIRREFASDAVALLPDPFRRLHAVGGDDGPTPPSQELGVAAWVLANGRPAGRGTATLPAGEWLHLPLPGAVGPLGVLAVRARDPERLQGPDRLHLLEAFANQIAAALQRGRLAEEARRVERLEELDRLKSEFVATASHELRTPLVALTSGIELLRERVGPRLDGGDAALLASAEREGVRLRHLVDALLDLSRLEAGEMPLALAPTPVRPLVDDAVEAYAALAAERGVALAREVPDDLPPVRADPARIAAVLGNLLGNALRFTPRGGQVLVTADAVGDLVQLSVADNGVGVPLEHQARIFDRFVQVPGRETTGGAGLGLAIARETVQAHGGTIWVDSGPGPGSVFSFTLPAAPSERPGEQPDEHAAG